MRRLISNMKSVSLPFEKGFLKLQLQRIYYTIISFASHCKRFFLLFHINRLWLVTNTHSIGTIALSSGLHLHVACWSRWSTPPVTVESLRNRPDVAGEWAVERALWCITSTSPERGVGFQFVYDLRESAMHVIGKEKRNGLVYPAGLWGSMI